MQTNCLYLHVNTYAYVHLYLKVGELGVVEVWVDVQRSPHHQQRLKLVQRGTDVTSKAKTPDLQKSFQVEQDGKSNLKSNEENRCC